MLAGSDGPYFALQVKYLIEHHRLAFPDMPLLFTWGAFFSKVLYALHFGSLNDCILLSVRLTDTFLPPLTAIPVFLIAKEFYSQRKNLDWAGYVMIAFATLSYTPLVHFSYQLQKNGSAIPLVFLYFYYVIRIIKYQHRGDFVKALVVLFVCALTHFGSCGMLLFSSFLILIGWLFSFAQQPNYPVKKVLLVVTCIILILCIIAFLDLERFERMIHAPLKLFEAPVILFSLSGQNLMFFQPLITILILINLLAILGIVVIVRNRFIIDKYKVFIGLSFAICTLFMANPFLGLEWAKRLFMMAYIPLTVLYLLIFSFITTKWLKTFSILAFLFLLIISFASALFQKPFISISNKAFAEFRQLNSKVDFNNNDAIVSRQDLRLLANWSFQSKGVSDYLLTKNEFNKFHSVYFIQQVKDKSLGIREAKKPLPENYYKLFAGNYFEVYKITSVVDLPIEPEKIFKGIRGVIVERFANGLLVKDYKTGLVRTVYIKNEKQNPVNLPVESKVEINGELTPFSLAIRAETIKKVKSFE